VTDLRIINPSSAARLMFQHKLVVLYFIARHAEEDTEEMID
jgi:hypothetical protein